jgi:PAS domain S-box-containing protein
MASAYDRSSEMESRYRALFENNHSVMLIIDPSDGRILDANQAAARYYGWPLDVLKRMRISEINRLTPDEVAAEMRRARAEEKKQFYFRHLRADGSVRDVEVFSGPIQFEGRRVLYSIVHDITERVATERSLAESELRFRNLAERAPDGIFIDTGGYFQYVNPAACRLLGASGMGQLSGTRVLDRIHPDSLPQVNEDLRQILDDKLNVTDRRLELLRLDGTIFQAEVRAVGIPHWGQPSILFYIRAITP